MRIRRHVTATAIVVVVGLLGLPQIEVPYAMTGTDATAIFMLWDVAPDGTRTLVTRGVWRLIAGTDPPAGAATGLGTARRGAAER